MPITVEAHPQFDVIIDRTQAGSITLTLVPKQAQIGPASPEVVISQLGILQNRLQEMVQVFGKVRFTGSL